MSALSDLGRYPARWNSGLQTVFHEAKVPYRLKSLRRSARTAVFMLGLRRTSDLEKAMRLNDRLAFAMGAEQVRLGTAGNRITVEIPLPPQLRRNLSPVSLRHRKGTTWVNLGLTALGQPLYVNLAGQNTTHTLISGMTGSGKTYAQAYAAWSLARTTSTRQAGTILIDAKGDVLWRGFEREQHLLHPLIREYNEGVRALAWTLAELDRRRETGQSEPQLFVIVDEIYMLISHAPKVVPSIVQKITSVGRSLGIHLIMATQYPDRKAVGGMLAKANVGFRLTGRVPTKQIAYVCSSVAGTQAETLLSGGDFIATAGAGQVHRCTIPYMQQRHLGDLIRHTDADMPYLDLGVDPDLVDDTTETGGWQVEPDHLAQALVHDIGIKRLQALLHVGQPKARQARQYRQALLEALRALGHTIVPVPGISS